MDISNIISLSIFAVVFVILVIAVKKSSASNRHYDEMQLKIRGDAYKCSLFTVIALLIIIGFAYGFSEINLSRFLDNPMLCFSIAYIGIIVFVVYSIINDAFFAVYDNKVRYFIVCGVIIITNIVGLFGYINSGELKIETGVSFSNGGAQLLNVICFSVIIVAVLVKTVINKQENDE